MSNKDSQDAVAIPPDGWWFPDYVPKRARMLSREEYLSAVRDLSKAWQVEHAAKTMTRKAGRPRNKYFYESWQFLLLHAVEQMKMGQEGVRVTDTDALRRMTGKKDVEVERARLNRVRKEMKALRIFDD